MYTKKNEVLKNINPNCVLSNNIFVSMLLFLQLGKHKRAMALKIISHLDHSLKITS